MELPAATKDITVEWLNQALHENGLLETANIVSVKREQIGVGAGFMSEIARLTVAYDETFAHLPRTIIAKLPPITTSAREGAIRENLFEREIRFYAEVAPASPIRTPRLVYSAMDSKVQRYVLLMEDLSRYTPADPELNGLSYEQATLIALKIADFHAKWWNAADRSSFPWLPSLKAGMIQSAQRILNRWDACCQMSHFVEALPLGGLEAGAKLAEKFGWLAENMPQDDLTITHGDLKTDNIFFDWDNTEDPLIVFDWSGTTTIARGVTDVSYLLGTSLTVEMRRQVEKDIVNQYYERLLNKGIADYTFEQCWKDYLRGLLVRTPGILFVFSAVDPGDPRRLKTVRTLLNRRFSAIVDNEATKILL